MSWAKVGMKVVCVDAIPRILKDVNGNYQHPSVWGMKFPQEGGVYTVSGFTSAGGVYLKEVSSGCMNGNREPVGYAIDRFRPLVTKTIEDDIALFRRIADTVPCLEDAE